LLYTRREVVTPVWPSGLILRNLVSGYLLPPCSAMSNDVAGSTATSAHNYLIYTVLIVTSQTTAIKIMYSIVFSYFLYWED
jgi:hypothetical protein